MSVNVLDLSEKIKSYDQTAVSADTQKNGKRFEDHVITVLTQNGYTITSAKDPSVVAILKTLKSRLAAEHQTIPAPAGETLTEKKLLIQQPYGSQYPPDILLLIITPDEIHYQCLEIKTGIHRATWNNTYPKSNWIYIFSGTEGVTMFTGQHILSEDILDLFEDYKNARKRLTDVYNQRLKDLSSSWILVDYFKFEHRSNVKYKRDENCEAREKDVISRLQSFSLKETTTIIAAASDSDSDSEVESPLKEPAAATATDAATTTDATAADATATVTATDAESADDDSSDEAESSLLPIVRADSEASDV